MRWARRKRKGAARGSPACLHGPDIGDGQRQNFYAEIELNGMSFRGRGECTALLLDFPEPRLFPVRCQLLLTGLPPPYVGGLLTTNTMTSAAAFGGDSGAAGLYTGIDRHHSSVEEEAMSEQSQSEGADFHRRGVIQAAGLAMVGGLLTAGEHAGGRGIDAIRRAIRFADHVAQQRTAGRAIARRAALRAHRAEHGARVRVLHRGAGRHGSDARRRLPGRAHPQHVADRPGDRGARAQGQSARAWAFRIFEAARSVWTCASSSSTTW